MNGLDRRGFLALVGSGAVLGASALPAQQRAPAAGSGDAGQLFDPRAAGRPRAPVTEAENDARIQAIEKQLKCTCGCNLDVYTCRTTDFTCTVSPMRHREIVAWHEAGLSDAEVIERYLETHGSEFRMAPKPEGFNLAGYLVPGILVLIAGLVLAFVLRRRGALEAGPVGGVPLSGAVDATPEELEQLRRAMAEVDE